MTPADSCVCEASCAAAENWSVCKNTLSLSANFTPLFSAAFVSFFHLCLSLNPPAVWSGVRLSLTQKEFQDRFLKWGWWRSLTFRALDSVKETRTEEWNCLQDWMQCFCCRRAYHTEDELWNAYQECAIENDYKLKFNLHSGGAAHLHPKAH